MFVLCVCVVLCLLCISSDKVNLLFYGTIMAAAKNKNKSMLSLSESSLEKGIPLSIG